MRHAVAGYKLNRDPEHRRAMWRNMAIALFTHGQITTTLPKAKSVQPFVEKLITKAKRGDLASRRAVIAELGGDPFLVRSEDDPDLERDKRDRIVRGPRVVKHLFDEIAPRYADRPGGYTRVIRLATHRIGDGSDLVVLQLVGDEEGPQVRGRTSRRRQQQHHRAAYAAQLRRGKGEAKAEPAAEQAPAEDAPAPESQAPPEAEAQTPDQPDTDKGQKSE